MNNLQELVCIINSSLVISMPYTVYTTSIILFNILDLSDDWK